MSLDIYCTYCSETAVLIRNKVVGKNIDGKKITRKEYLCNNCIGREERGELNQQYQTVDNL